jgi:multiple sugar transport system permease protein
MASQRLLDSPPAARPRSRRLSTKSAVTTILGLLFVGLWAFPFLYMLLSTFKTPIDNISMPPKFIFEPTTDNYATVFGNPDVLRFLRSSLIVASLSTAVALLLAFPAAYGLVRFRRFYRTERVAYLFLLLQMLPIISLVFPYFAIGQRLGIRDTHLILILTYTYWNVAWGIWLIRGFIEAVPAELDEAALVDGCSRPQALWKVVIPVSAKGLVAAAILIFIGAWNEFTLAFFLTARTARTYPTIIGFFLTHSGIRWGEMFVAATLGTLPIVVFALLVRKSFISSLSFGAVKG